MLIGMSFGRFSKIVANTVLIPYSIQSINKKRLAGLKWIGLEVYNYFAFLL